MHGHASCYVRFFVKTISSEQALSYLAGLALRAHGRCMDREIARGRDQDVGPFRLSPALLELPDTALARVYLWHSGI